MVNTGVSKRKKILVCIHDNKTLTYAVDVVTKALEYGCNYFDTAEAYDAGASEKTLGEVLSSLGEKKKQAVIGS